MLNDLVTQAIEEAHNKAADKQNDYISKCWTELENYLIEFQSVTKDVKLPDDCFDKYSPKVHKGETKYDAILSEATFTGKNYEIKLRIREPKVAKNKSERLKTIQVSGFTYDKNEYDIGDYNIFNAVAQIANTKFKPFSEWNSYIQQIKSGVLNLKTHHTQIKNIGEIISNIQNATMACEQYEDEQKAYINNTANRLLKYAYKNPVIKV